jgi:hypothetical protein
MDHIENIFQIGDRIKLKDIDMSILGEFARCGQEGIVANIEREKYGYPRIAVEWDRSHWADNSQPNAWCFQDWFDLVPVDPSIHIISTDGNKVAELIDEFTVDILTVITEASKHD